MCDTARSCSYAVSPMGHRACPAVDRRDPTRARVSGAPSPVSRGSTTRRKLRAPRWSGSACWHRAACRRPSIRAPTDRPAACPAAVPVGSRSGRSRECIPGPRRPTLVVMASDDYVNSASAPGQDYAAYAMSGTDLRRVRCGPAGSSNIVVAQFVQPGSTLTCTYAVGSGDNCTSSSSTKVPVTMRLALAVNVPDGSPGTLTVTLSGTRRIT